MSNTTLQLSVKLFRGYKVNIPTFRAKFLTEKQLILKVKNEMKYLFIKNNLLELSEKVENMNMYFDKEINYNKTNYIHER